MITLFSSLQVIFQIKSNTNFHAHESYPIIKAIFGKNIESEKINSMEEFAERASDSVIVEFSLLIFFEQNLGNLKNLVFQEYNKTKDEDISMQFLEKQY